MHTYYISSSFRDHIEVIVSLSLMIETIDEVAERCAEAIKLGNKIFFCGNGGSAADSQHLAGELVGRLKEERKPLAAIALGADIAVLTCITNDYGYQDVFSRQIEALAKPGDVLFAISTSGNSANVLRAQAVASQMGLVTVGLLGGDGGKLSGECDLELNVTVTRDTARIQEAHMLMGHTICALIEKKLDLVAG